MLADAIIAGVREKRFQERLLKRGESLTLIKAIELPQQYEIQQKQMKIVRDEDSQVSAVSDKPKPFAPIRQMPFKGNSASIKRRSTHQRCAPSAEKTRSTSGIKASAQQKAQSALIVTNKTTGQLCAISVQSALSPSSQSMNHQMMTFSA